MKKFLGALLLLVCGFVAGFFSHAPYRQWKITHDKKVARDKVLREAPPISSRLLDGKPWVLSQHRGRILVIDYWATWCKPCVERIPEMKELHAKYANDPDVEVIGVSLDEDRGKLAEFVRTEGLQYPIVFEEGQGWGNSMARAYAIDAIPSLWVLDRNQKAVGVDLRDKNEVTRLIEELRKPGRT